MAGATVANDGSVSTQQGLPAGGMPAKGELNIKGSSVVAINDVKLNAGADINVIAAQDTHDETHYTK